MLTNVQCETLKVQELCRLYDVLNEEIYHKNLLALMMLY